MIIHLKNMLKKNGVEVLKYLFFKAKSNIFFKKILHPIFIKTPYLNKLLSYLKNKLFPTPSVIGPLITSPSKIQDLSPLGQRLYNLLQKKLK